MNLEIKFAACLVIFQYFSSWHNTYSSIATLSI